MFNNNFGKKLDILHRSMDVSVLRRGVISNNIANADTPNFKRSTINFETKLKESLDSENRNHILNFDNSGKYKITFKKPNPYTSVKPTRELDYLSQINNNGNNVDMEEEMMSAMQNQLRYEMMANSVRNMFERVKRVIR